MCYTEGMKLHRLSLGWEFVLKHWTRTGRLKGYFYRNSTVPFVFIFCQVPMKGLIIDFLLAISPIQHPHGLIGSILGILPEAIPWIVVGSDAFEVANQNILNYGKRF